MTEAPTRWPTAVRQRLENAAIDTDDLLDAAWRRFDARMGRNLPRHFAAYRGYADARGAELFGRVLAEAPQGGPLDTDGWWDNLLNTYRRFDSREVPGVAIRVRFRDAQVDTLSDHEGYYTAAPSTTAAPSDQLWDNAMVSLHDGTLATPQPLLQVGEDAGFGLISDIDDTVLHTGITSWKTAAQLTFLHNARTRKPLDGVAKLYQALQHGADGSGCHPIFYVSSSPWNMYDLLEDFMELNAIPCGPLFLRDYGTDPGKFIATPGHEHKLERTRMLIERFPQLRWVLMGDSGQADAELYAEAARSFGDRIAAIYIRDVDPEADSPYDLKVDGFIERVAGTSVPMLRARDSLAIAEHAAGLGLIAPEAVAQVAAEVRRDQQRPELGEAALDSAVEAGPAPT
ncbi:MAG TPA: phosphatase domain-containing protein [Lysobacter sp.]|nr:phosphatase domain-containing protein [Lysobacter sp.]